MIFHLGISPSEGEVAAYNVNDKERFHFKIAKLENFLKIDETFEEVKAKLNGRLGYACIILKEYKSNDVRKKIIESGKQRGFVGIQIIDLYSIPYLNYIPQTNYKPISGDVIWVVGIKFFTIYEKVKKRARVIKELPRPATENFFMETIKNLGFDRNPKLIFFYENFFVPQLSSNMVKNAFPKSIVIITSYLRNGSEVALLKARIMSNDPEVMEYDVDTHIDYQLSIKLQEKQIMSFEKASILPLKLEAEIIDKNKQEILLISTGRFSTTSVCEKLNLPNYERIKIDLNIDENGVYTINFSPSSNKDSNIARSDNITQDKLLHTYKIPKKMKANDKINAVGIDLGTSRCFAAVNRRNGIETVALDNTGERQLPSYVSFNNTNAECGQIVVNRLQQNAKSTVFDSKRIIGRSFDEVKMDETWPFKVINNRNKPKIEINCLNESRRISRGEKLFEVVITVPAAFTAQQKSATQEAGELGGWKKVNLLPEPVAAAFAYFVDRPIPNKFNMLLFDFGGGTLDVCIMNAENETLNIISTAGDGNLGGRDFDNLIFNNFSSILKRQYSVDIQAKDKLKYSLMQKCMEIKHTLSVRKEDLLDVNDFNTNIEGTLILTSLEFESMASLLLNKVRKVIVAALSTANFTSKDIHKVLLVGGSSRMPMIQMLLRKMFIKSEHCCEENPDEVVAIGAAYYAYYLKSKD